MAVIGSTSLLLTMVMGPSFAENAAPLEGDQTGTATPALIVEPDASESAESADAEPKEEVVVPTTTPSPTQTPSDPPKEEEAAPIVDAKPAPIPVVVDDTATEEGSGVGASGATGSDDGAKKSAPPATNSTENNEATNPSEGDEAVTASIWWTVNDTDGVLQEITTFEVQGLGGTDPTVDSQWTGITATVTDNTGQAGYDGLDVDPKVGAFEVEELESKSNASVTEAVADNETYRIRPTEAPEGFEVGDDATWQASKGAEVPKAQVDTYVLTTPEITGLDSKPSADVDGPQLLLAPDAAPGAIMPFAAPPGSPFAGSYGPGKDADNPAGWYGTWAQGTPGQAQFNSFDTYIEPPTVGSDTPVLYAKWTRPGPTGAFGWSVEYTVAAERWGNAKGDPQMVPQPDRSLGGTVFIIDNESKATIYCTYGPSNYPGTCTPLGAVVEYTVNPDTVILRVPLTSAIIGTPGCPPAFGSTSYLRSWTGNNSVNARNLVNWTQPRPLDTNAISTCATLNLTKTVDSTFGGDKIAADWTVTANPTVTTDGQTTITGDGSASSTEVVPGTYT